MTYATNKQPGGAIRIVWPPEDTERHEPLAVVAPDDQHVDNQLPSKYRADCSDGYFNMIYIFIPTNYTLCKNCQIVILFQEAHFVSNLLR